MNLRTLLKDNTLVGAGAAVVLAFPMASLCALVFRFPIPFAGYESGVAAAGKAFIAAALYGALGGFVLVAVLGAMGGVLADFLMHGFPVRARRLTIILATASAAACVLVMAMLDWIIGPW
jgi:hypothetical protein